MRKRWLTLTTPLLFQSKILCFSLFYFWTAIPLAIFISLSHQPVCKFARYSSNSSNHHLFSYPKSYGEHKHALPTTRDSCTASVRISDYELAYKEIHDICENRWQSSSIMKYMRGGRQTFAGNFSVQERNYFFNHGSDDDRVEIPCGFFKEFPVSESDRLKMEKCNGVVVVSAIFNNHDKIRQPKGLASKTLETVCFFMFIDESTHTALKFYNILLENKTEERKIGAWTIVILQSNKLPYENPSMNGVIPKHLIHRLFPNSVFSVWLDAKIQLTVDPILLVHSLVVSKNVDMAISKHPFNLHTMEEAMATARWKKWGDIESLRVQMETYCQNGLMPWSTDKRPYTTDVPDTALIVRRHKEAMNKFSCLLFNELEGFNPRDQLAFAYVRDLMNPKIKINMFEVEVFEQIAIEYRHNIKKGDTATAKVKTKKNRRASFRDVKGSSCENYLLQMWSGSEVINI